MLREGAFAMETSAVGGEEGKAPLLMLNHGASWQESRPALNWQERNVVGIQRTGQQAPPHTLPLGERLQAAGQRQDYGIGSPLPFPFCLLAFFPQPYLLTVPPSLVWEQENNPKN